MRSCSSEEASLAERARRSRLVSSARAGAARAPGPARRRRRFEPRAAARPPMSAACSPGTRRSSPSSGGRPIRAWCSFRRSSSLAQSRQDLAERPLRVPFRHRVRGDNPRLRRAAPLGCRHLAQHGNDRFLRGAASTGVMATRWKSGEAMRSSADSTGCSSAVYFSANRCSAASAMPRKWRLPAWWRSAAAATSSSSTARSRARISPAWAPARSRATNSCTCCSAGRDAFPAAAWT